MSYAAQSKPRISVGEFWVLPTIFALMLSACFGLIALGAGLNPNLWVRIALVAVGLVVSQAFMLSDSYDETFEVVLNSTSRWFPVWLVSVLLSLAGAAIGMLIAVGIMSYA